MSGWWPVASETPYADDMPCTNDTNVGGPRRFTATGELAGEYPNLRSTLAWTVENRETQIGLRLARSLNFLWQVHGSLREGLGWVGQLLALPGADEPTAARAGALVAAARLAELVGDFEAARAFCQEALPLTRQVAEPLLEFLALLFALNNARGIGDMVTANHCAREALACARATGDLIGEGTILVVLARIACDQADYTAAEPLAEQALRLARGDAWIEAWALAATARAALGQGALQEARAALNAALSMAREQGQPTALTGVIFDALGELATASGQPHQARDWLVSSLDVRYEGGEVLLIAQTLDRLAALAASCAQPERALLLAGAADALYEKFGARRTQAEQQNVERWLLPLSNAFGEQATNDLRAQGRAQGLERAVTLARGGDKKDAQPSDLEPSARAASALTAREQQVAALLTRGLSNRQIAEQLVITERTVAAHIEHILDKLGFASRHQVGAWAAEHGLLG